MQTGSKLCRPQPVAMMVDTQTLSELQKILLHLSTDSRWMVTRTAFSPPGLPA